MEKKGGIPVESMVVVEQDTGEFTSGVEVGPIDCGVAPKTRVLKKRLEGWVERGQMGKVRWVLRILVVGVNGGSLSLPLLVATHFSKSNLFFFSSLSTICAKQASLFLS